MICKRHTTPSNPNDLATIARLRSQKQMMYAACSMACDALTRHGHTAAALNVALAVAKADPEVEAAR